MTSTDRCHDCGVAPGTAHNRHCDVARCLNCGGQRLSCDCPQAGKDIWTGEWPGKADAIRFGFWCVETKIPGAWWKRVPAGTPGARPDLNRLMEETVWDRKTQTRVLW